MSLGLDFLIVNLYLIAYIYCTTWRGVSPQSSYLASCLSLITLNPFLQMYSHLTLPCFIPLPHPCFISYPHIVLYPCIVLYPHIALYLHLILYLLLTPFSIISLHCLSPQFYHFYQLQTPCYHAMRLSLAPRSHPQSLIRLMLWLSLIADLSHTLGISLLYLTP